MKITRGIPLVTLIALAVSVSVSAQPAPTLLPEPEYTEGTTNTICWTIPEGHPTISAYELQVSSTGEFPDSTDPNFSIWPIPASDVTDNCFEVGVDLLDGVPADDPLRDGVEYCYRIRYRYVTGTGEYGFSPWSDTVCSTQDNSPPLVSPDEISVWTNRASLTINFTAEDAVCSGVSTVKLYYRLTTGEDWNYYATYDVPSVTSPIEGFIVFNSSDISGDTYYEFFLAGTDSLGNEWEPDPELDEAQLWTRFDTVEPVSSVIADSVPLYYTDIDIPIYYTGSDTGSLPSGIDTLKLMYSYHGEEDTVYNIKRYEGATEVSDSMRFVPPRGDGEYRIYTMAVDSAGNIELIADYDASFYVDTRAPEMMHTVAQDMTDTPSWTEAVAEPGYTNTEEIHIDLVDPCDPINGEYFASGIDSVIIATDEALTENVARLDYIGDVDYPYTLPEGDGLKDTYTAIKDSAGNMSDVHHSAIYLDTQPPALLSVSVTSPFGADTTAFTAANLVNIVPDGTVGAPYKMYLTEDSTSIGSIPDDAWLDFSLTTTFDFDDASTPNSWLKIYCVVKDSAGSLSNIVVDSVYYDPADHKEIALLGIRDIDGPDTTGRFTDSVLVELTIRYGNDIDSMFITDDRSADTVRVRLPYITLPETTIVFEYEISHPEADNRDRWISVRGLDTGDPLHPTAWDSLSIFLDLTNPRLPSISTRDVTTEFSYADTSEVADAGWTNDEHIKVYFNDPTDIAGSGIYWYKLRCESTEEEGEYSPFVHFDLPAGDGAKYVQGWVQDSAGNWSSPFDEGATSIITLDTHDPSIISVQLKDATSGSYDYTDSPDIIVEIAGEDGELTPAYIAIFERRSAYPAELSDIWRDYSTSLDYTLEDTATPGEKIVYAALKDRAGNISLLDSSSIVYLRGARFKFTLFDYDSPVPDSIYANNNVVEVQFNIPPSAPPPGYYYLSESFVEDIDTIEWWIPFPADGETTYTFSDVSEGEKLVYGWVKSVSGEVSPPESASIVLDKTAPELASGFVCVDTTTVEHFPDIFFADTSWSNSPYIWAVFGDIEDNLSGVDSLRFWGSIEDSLWHQELEFTVNGDTLSFDYDPAIDTINLILMYDTTEVSRPVGIAARDSADNWGNNLDFNSLIVADMKLDMLPPVIDFTQDGESIDSIVTVNPPTVEIRMLDRPAPGFISRVYFWADELPDTVLIRADSTWAGSEIVNVPFGLHDLVTPDRLYHIYALAVDSAGNPSNIDTLKMWVVPETLSYNFVLFDMVDTTDSEFTNNQTVRVVIFSDLDAVPDSMRISEDRRFRGVRWVPFSYSDSTYTFATPVNEPKTVYCQIMQGAYPSGIDSATIILDTIPPTVDGIRVMDATTDDENWSDDYRVKIVVEGAADVPPGEVASLLVSESEDFSVNRQILPFTLDDPTVYYTCQEQKYIPESGGTLGDKRTIYARVLDRAENPSGTVTDEIIVDVEKAEVSNFPNPFDPNTETATIRIKAGSPGEKADVKLFDAFGNLVWSKEITLSERLTDIVWDGKNDKGKTVGNGGYICVVKIGNKVYRHKIAVWKRTE
ncbi:hypothetical protein J7K18_06910 [bacterium]|nr:hypothetical protein [bacterium]